MDGEQKNDISHAIICSYALDLAWIYNFFLPLTPVVVVTQPGPAGASMRYAFPNWILTTPSLGPSGRGCMHIKVSQNSP
jgi:tyrosyl-DNA phosphodiesterase 1